MKIVSFTTQKGRALSVLTMIDKLESEIKYYREQARRIRSYDKKYGTNLYADSTYANGAEIMNRRRAIEFLKSLIVVEETK
jgi:hypothetical protein